MHIQRLSPSHAPVFLVNSRYPLVCATHQSSGRKVLHPSGSPLYRRHGSDLPSSLTRIRSIALVFSTCPPVSVWGTGGHGPHAEAFLDGLDNRISSHNGSHHHTSPCAPCGFAYMTGCVLDHGKPPPRPAPIPCHPCADLLRLRSQHHAAEPTRRKEPPRGGG